MTKQQQQQQQQKQKQQKHAEAAEGGLQLFDQGVKVARRGAVANYDVSEFQADSAQHLGYVIPEQAASALLTQCIMVVQRHAAAGADKVRERERQNDRETERQRDRKIEGESQTEGGRQGGRAGERECVCV
jgi:hypothetical protein